MAVTVTSGELQRTGGTFQSVEALAQSTATVAQSISITTDVSTIPSGTATGSTRNLFTLATGAVEGQMKTIVMLGTGEANVQLGGGTATEFYVLSAADDWINCMYLNDGWSMAEQAFSLQLIEALSDATSTALGTVSITTDISTIGAGTATGEDINRWLLATGAREGQTKTVLMLGTGEAKVQLGGGTATGSHVLSAAEDWIRCVYIQDQWMMIQNTATLATATEPA